MSYLSNIRWVSIDTLKTQLNFSSSILSEVLENLTSRGLIQEKGHLLKSKPLSSILGIKRIKIYEAKLTHWKGAVDQAERNLWFTKDSYVVMPPKVNNVSQSLLRECTKRGVGLSYLDTTKKIQTALKPSCGGLINSPLLWSINEKLLEEIHENRTL
jgi:hypothetical protein